MNTRPLRDKTITVFGSSVPREGEPEYQLAYEIGKLVALRGGVVCNGGCGGIMEASARGASENGGRAIGVLARGASPAGNRFLTAVTIVETMIDRLQKLISLGDAYIILAGGTGTLLELAAIWEFMNKGLMAMKPAVVLGDFFSPMVERMQSALCSEGRDAAARAIRVAASPEECVAIIESSLLTQR